MIRPAMKMPLRLLKDAGGALDPAWIAMFAQTLGARAFVETGTYLGQSLENVCGLFERVLSIELSPELHEAALRRFAHRRHVMLLQGDSAGRIGDAYALCDGLPTLFWLDAHWSAGNTARGEENTPILKELAIIAERASADDVILIDDIRYFISIPEGFPTHESNAGYPLLRDILSVLARFPGGGFEAVLLGDVLVCVSRDQRKLLQTSAAVEAITALRISPDMDAARRAACERSVAAASGAERAVFMTLPDHYKDALQYGIGGEFCYWRGLVREAANDTEGARADFDTARRCGLDIPARAWEVAA